MRTLRFELETPLGGETLEDAVAFVGSDASGSFGLLPDAERRVTVLAQGLAQVQRANGSTRYLALMGGVLDLRENTLRVATSSYAASDDRSEIVGALESLWHGQEERVREIKESLRRLEEGVLQRMAEIERGAT